MLRSLVGPARFELATSTMSRLTELATTRYWFAHRCGLLIAVTSEVIF